MVDYQFDADCARLTSLFSLSRLVAHVKAKMFLVDVHLGNSVMVLLTYRRLVIPATSIQHQLVSYSIRVVTSCARRSWLNAVRGIYVHCIVIEGDARVDGG
ncbi:hypothetical protein CASFOL_002131 [Castilleja foliolosa]|uniref:Uncharacterized protein n=1 Tax=Castilleja foliolosa TaxID=1961234 RepID=A0ABD3EH44_9LAMI